MYGELRGSAKMSATATESL